MRLIDADYMKRQVDIHGTNKYGMLDENIRVFIDQQPTIESESPHWIPVTERLPKEKQDVLLAFKHNMAVGFWEDILNDGGQAWYANSGNGWFTGTEAVDDDGYPIAWMPLPEPFQRGEEDE